MGCMVKGSNSADLAGILAKGIVVRLVIAAKSFIG